MNAEKDERIPDISFKRTPSVRYLQIKTAVLSSPQMHRISREPTKSITDFGRPKMLKNTVNGTAPFKNVNNCLNMSIYSYSETSGSQSSNLYLNAVHFFNTSVN